MTAVAHVPNSYYLLVGQVVIHWSYTEVLMQTCIWGLLNIDEKKARTLTTHLNYKTLMQMLRTLVHDRWGDAGAEDFKQEILKPLDCLKGIRDAYVHRLWWSAPARHDNEDEWTEFEVIQEKRAARTKLEFQEIPVSPDNIGNVVTQIDIASHDLINFFVSRDVYVPLP